MSLLAPDIAQLASDRRSDDLVNSLLLICVCVFAVEIVLASLARRGYFLSFFWVLDLVATVSIAIAIPYGDLFEGGGGGDCGAESVVESNDFVTQAGRTLRLVRQGGRALRVVRALRLVALVKAFGVVTQWCRPNAEEEKEQRLDEAMGDELSADKSTQATRIGRHLAFLSSVRVVYIILLLSITLPFAVNETQSIRGKESIASLLAFMAGKPAIDSGSIDNAISTVDSITGIDFMRVRLNGTQYRDANLENVRCSDLFRVDIEQLGMRDEITFDIKSESDARSVFNLVYVSVVLVVLVLSIVLSDRETRYFVVKPLMRITRILASLRQKLAQSFIDLDESEWETEVVERYILGMAQWIEHQQRRGLLPTKEEEEAEHRLQRRMDEAAASKGSIAAHGRLLLTRTASGIRQLLDWGGNSNDGSGKARRHTLGGAAASALASDLMVSQPWVDRNRQDERLLGHGDRKSPSDLARRATMLSMRPAGGSSMEGGGAAGRMRRMQSAVPGGGPGRQLWRNQSMRFYGDEKSGWRSDRKPAADIEARARVSSDAAEYPGKRPRDGAVVRQSIGRHRGSAMGSRLRRGGAGDSFVDHARDDEMGGVPASELPTGLVGLGKFIRRDEQPGAKRGVGGIAAAAASSAPGEFPGRAHRVNSDGHSTINTKDDESVVQLWHHEDESSRDEDIGGAIGHWDSHRSTRPVNPPRPPPRAVPPQPRSAAGGAEGSALVSGADLSAKDTKATEPIIGEKQVAEADPSAKEDRGPVQLTEVGRSRSDSQQRPAGKSAAAGGKLPPKVGRLDTAPAGDRDRARLGTRPDLTADASPSSGDSRLASEAQRPPSTLEVNDFGLSPQLLPQFGKDADSHSRAGSSDGTPIVPPLALGTPAADGPSSVHDEAGVAESAQASSSSMAPSPPATARADSQSLSLSDGAEPRSDSPEDSAAIAPLQSRRFGGFSTAMLRRHQHGHTVDMPGGPIGKVLSARSANAAGVAVAGGADLHHLRKGTAPVGAVSGRRDTGAALDEEDRSRR